MTQKYILAIDQGTTSSRAIMFDQALQPRAVGQEEFRQIFPQSGWVEHDPEEIWSSSAGMCREAIEKVHASGSDIAAIGITNQRETTIVWDRLTGRAVYNAIVWQDRRTSEFCQSLQDQGCADWIAQKTGLLIDPYFSATKLHWILENVHGVRARAEAGDLLFGTIDSYLIWRLSSGTAHVTDATNAARTMLYNIVDGTWDPELLALFDIPPAMMPEVKDSSGPFAVTCTDLFGGARIAITGAAGDQQAATVGQACFKPGMAKSTYGTGCFVLMNTGDEMILSKNRMLTTIAYQFDGKPTYALEGSIFIAGAVVQWLRDGLQLIRTVDETQALAERADPTEAVYFVPAFTGLGAPYWNAGCRGAIFGLTRNSGPAEISKAALESVAFQTRDLMEAMAADTENLPREVLRVDGGMTQSDWMMQAIADQIGAKVDRPLITETTARGAAYLAARGHNLAGDLAEYAASWQVERAFSPVGSRTDSDQKYLGWKTVVAKLLYEPETWTKKVVATRHIL